MSKKKNKKRQIMQPVILNIKNLRVGERTYINNYYPEEFGHLCCCKDLVDKDHDCGEDEWESEADGDSNET